MSARLSNYIVGKLSLNQAILDTTSPSDAFSTRDAGVRGIVKATLNEVDPIELIMSLVSHGWKRASLYVLIPSSLNYSRGRHAVECSDNSPATVSRALVQLDTHADIVIPYFRALRVLVSALALP